MANWGEQGSECREASWGPNPACQSREQEGPLKEPWILQGQGEFSQALSSAGRGRRAWSLDGHQVKQCLLILKEKLGEAPALQEEGEKGRRGQAERAAGSSSWPGTEGPCS